MQPVIITGKAYKPRTLPPLGSVGEFGFVNDEIGYGFTPYNRDHWPSPDDEDFMCYQVRPENVELQFSYLANSDRERQMFAEVDEALRSHIKVKRKEVQYKELPLAV